MRPAADRQVFLLLVLIAGAAVAAGFSLSLVRDAAATAARPLPAPPGAKLSAFVAPLPSSPTESDAGTVSHVAARDPFRTRAASPKPAPVATVASETTGESRWVVSSILFDGAKRSAIVNDAWVSVGDELDNGARVTAIERTHLVVTDMKGIRHTVPIKGGAL